MGNEQAGVYPVGDGTEYRVERCSWHDQMPYYETLRDICEYKDGKYVRKYRNMVPEAEANAVARRVAAFYKGLYNVECAGRDAALAGKPRRCPITDQRTYHNNGVTFSRGRIRRWYAGYDRAVRDGG